MLPHKVSSEWILPGNGYTHATHEFGCWETSGTLGPDYWWTRTEYGLIRHWMVHDKAIGGTQEYFRCSVGETILCLVIGTFIAFICAGSSEIIRKIMASSCFN